jgi:hypothetical protein
MLLFSDFIKLWPSALFSSTTTKQGLAFNVEAAFWANVAVEPCSAFWAMLEVCGVHAFATIRVI